MNAQTPYDRIMADIEAAKLSVSAACTSAGLARNTLSQAKSQGGKLSLDTITAFAGLLKKPVGYYLGEPAAAASSVPATARFDMITPSPRNPRKHIDDESLRGLAESIAADGIHLPLLVRMNPAGQELYEIIAGERRWRAVQLLISEGRAGNDYELPIKPIHPCDDRRALEIAVTENVARKDMTPWEEAQAFASLVAAGAKVEEIAKTVGLVARTVQKRLRLVNDLAPEVQQALAAGTISVEIANIFASDCPKELQAEALEDFANIIGSMSAVNFKNQLTWFINNNTADDDDSDDGDEIESKTSSRSAPKQTKKQSAAEALRKLRADKAAATENALAQKIAGANDIALRLWMMSVIAHYSHDLPTTLEASDGIPVHIIEQLPAEFRKQFQDEADGYVSNTAEALGGFRQLREDADLISIWHWLADIDMAIIKSTFCHWVANSISLQLHRRGNYSGFDGVDPLTLDLAEICHVEIPAEILPPQVDLEEAIAGKPEKAGKKKGAK